jgi:SAM-dependent methyltransferase
MFTNLNLTDMETCYKMIRTDVMKSITIEQNRFGFEPEITAKLARMNLHIYEVGISYSGRSYAEGKKIGWKDGLKAVWCIVKYSRGRYRDYGRETLQTLSGFNQYSQWMYSRVRRHMGNRVMEIGCGIGNNLENLASSPDTEIILTDYRQDYLQELKDSYKQQDRLSFYLYDATTDASPELKAHAPDTIVMFNVLEHIQQDELALSNLFNLVQPGGRLIVLVPAFQALYCKIDENLEHFRRYSMKELQDKMARAGFQIVDSFYFNAVGAAGWFVAGKILRASQIKEGHVKGQKVMMPIARAVDGLHLPIGLSVVCVGRKADSAQTGDSHSNASTGQEQNGNGDADVSQAVAQ